MPKVKTPVDFNELTSQERRPARGSCPMPPPPGGDDPDLLFDERMSIITSKGRQHTLDEALEAVRIGRGNKERLDLVIKLLTCAREEELAAKRLTAQPTDQVPDGDTPTGGGPKPLPRSPFGGEVM